MPESMIARYTAEDKDMFAQCETSYQVAMIQLLNRIAEELASIAHEVNMGRRS